MRVCKQCSRHVRTEDTRCPFCSAELGLLHAMPVVTLQGDPRPLPMYGGPPRPRAVLWIAALLLLLGLAFAGVLWRLR